MDKLYVRGGKTLSGAVHISGSKNASLPILAATLLTDEPCIIRRVPDVSDTNYMVQILSAMGADVERSSGTVRITCDGISDTAPYELVRRMRAYEIEVVAALCDRVFTACVAPLFTLRGVATFEAYAAAEAMAAEFAHHAIAVLFRMRLDRRADIAQPRAGPGRGAAPRSR